MEIPIALQAWILKEDFFDGMRSKQAIQNWAKRLLSQTQDPSDDLLDLSSDRKKSQNHLNSLLSTFIDPSVLSWQSTEILFGVIGKRFSANIDSYDGSISNLCRMHFVDEFEMGGKIRVQILEMFRHSEYIYFQKEVLNSVWESDEATEINFATQMLKTFITPYVELLGDHDFSL